MCSTNDYQSQLLDYLTFARHEGFTTSGAFVVEENAVAGKHVIGLAIINAHPKRVEFGATVRRSGVERRLLALRNLLHFAVKFTAMETDIKESILPS